MYPDETTPTPHRPTHGQTRHASDPQAQRDAVWKALQAALPESDLPSVQDCVTRLYASLPDKQDLSRNTVMVAYGGGKDSAHTTAFMRAVHLAMAERLGGETFQLRIVTMRHSGMPYVVMENIHRTYQALGVYEDPMVELLLIEREQVRPFHVNAPMPQPVVAYNRIDLLMSGHRSYGDGRTTFCNACNLNVANSFGVAARHGGGVDLIVTGDSPTEQRDYMLWTRKLSRKVGQQPSENKKFKGTLETLNGLAQSYFQEIHGQEQTERLTERRVASDVPDNLSFFSIYDHTDYESGAHWKLLTEFLGFVFDELAFSFTESDCANPALMAHMRGLRTEHVYQRSYREGIDQYADFAIALMKKKDFPHHLIAIMQQRYSTDEGIAAMRSMAEQYALSTFGLTTENLVCLVYSPFVGGCRHLHRYLAAEQPDLLGREAELVRMLAGKEAGDPALAARLERISGLSITDLRQIYASPVWSPFGAASDDKQLLPLITTSDPHQKLIHVRDGESDDPVLDRVSGR
jgi:hypothetical protein